MAGYRYCYQKLVVVVVVVVVDDDMVDVGPSRGRAPVVAEMMNGYGAIVVVVVAAAAAVVTRW